jgi:copper chaperone CopZ
MAVQKNLSKINLIKFEVAIGSAKVEFDEKEISEEVILKAIEEAGYQVINEEGYLIKMSETIVPKINRKISAPVSGMTCKLCCKS